MKFDLVIVAAYEWPRLELHFGATIIDFHFREQQFWPCRSSPKVVTILVTHPLCSADWMAWAHLLVKCSVDDAPCTPLLFLNQLIEFEHQIRQEPPQFTILRADECVTVIEQECKHRVWSRGVCATVQSLSEAEAAIFARLSFYMSWLHRAAGRRHQLRCRFRVQAHRARLSSSRARCCIQCTRLWPDGSHQALWKDRRGCLRFVRRWLRRWPGGRACPSPIWIKHWFAPRI